MKAIKLAYYWLQLGISIMITLFLGVVPFVRCIIQHSDLFYAICFAILIYVGISMLIRTSITELREAQRT